MFHQIKQYIKFLLKSTNQHGVHSPFVYDLVTKCFYDKKTYPDYTKILDLKKRLKRVKNKTVNITDLGAGSSVHKSKTRKISDIAKHSGTTKKNAKLLYRISKYLKPETILELGTSLGIATQAMSLGYNQSKITTIEGCPEISDYTQTHFDILFLNNITLLTGNFVDIIPTLNQTNFDLIFFDGNHQKEATLEYFEILLETAHNDSVFVFDDIYWSKGMTEAWETIKQHPRVTVSIDTFYWGFVFFRKEQVKEHFKIRV